MTTTPSTKERAQDAASTAADEGKHVAGVAKDEAQNVAAEAVNQARGLVDQALSQVDEQSRTQRDRAVGMLQSLSDDLEQMATQAGSSGLANDLAREIAQRARAISARLDGREPNEILDDVRSFARRRPGTFLLGALAAGVVAGRVVRGAKAAQDSGPSASGVTQSGSVSAVAATPGAPLAAPATHGYQTMEPAGTDVAGDPLSGGGPMGEPTTGAPETGTSLYGGPTRPDTTGSTATTPSYGQSEIAAPPADEGLSGGTRS
ncbi:hypothetical protein [Nocardioides pacificus]